MDLPTSSGYGVDPEDQEQFGPKGISGVNSKLIDHLTTIANYYELANEDNWVNRKAAYLKAVAKIRELNHSLLTKAEAMKLRNIGDKIGTTIEEFAKYGTSTRFQDLRKKIPDVDVLETFKSVFGIGIVTAIRLYREGYRTLDQLRQNLSTGGVALTRAQRLGLEYYNDIRKPIPRAKIQRIDEMLEFVRQQLGCIVGIVGSYRRKEPQSSDVDILITDTTMDAFLEVFSVTFGRVETLAKGKRKFMGIMEIGDGFGSTTFSRVDIRVFEMKHYPTALLYFTGSMEFNVLMRIRAISLTLKLSEYGLYFYDMTPVPVLTETDIFAALNTVWLEPEQRTKQLTRLQFGTAYDAMIAQIGISA